MGRYLVVDGTRNDVIGTRMFESLNIIRFNKLEKAILFAVKKGADYVYYNEVGNNCVNVEALSGADIEQLKAGVEFSKLN